MQAVAGAEAAQDLAAEAEGEQAAQGRVGAAGPTRVEVCGKRGRRLAEAVEVVLAAESRAVPAVVEGEPEASAELAAEERDQGQDPAEAVARVVAEELVSAMAEAQERAKGVVDPAEAVAAEVDQDLAAERADLEAQGVADRAVERVSEEEPARVQAASPGSG